MAFEPSLNIGMLVGGVVVDDSVDRLAHGDLLLDDVEEANELLMAMALHVAADHRAVEDVHRGKERCRAVTHIVVRHRSGAAFLQRQSGLRAIKRLNLTLFVDRQDNGVGGRIDIEPDDVAQFVDEARSFRSFLAVRTETPIYQTRLNEDYARLCEQREYNVMSRFFALSRVQSTDMAVACGGTVS